MHGLINRSLESFLRATYGNDLWRRIMEKLDVGFDSFEAMLSYDDALTQALVDSAAHFLGKPRDDLLEDFGTWLVCSPKSERVRRLLRFGGVDYADLLQSLDDMPGRARLAVPDLELPALELRESGEGEFTLTCTFRQEGAAQVLLGILRALADDYGTLVFIELLARRGDTDTLLIRLLEAGFSEGRDFSLAQEAV